MIGICNINSNDCLGIFLRLKLFCIIICRFDGDFYYIEYFLNLLMVVNLIFWYSCI